MSTTSQAQIFATEYAKNAAGNMLDVIKAIANRASLITKIALGVSMPHQIGYILALAVPHMHFNSPSGFLEAITMILLAIGVPIATDLLILNCIETIGAAAAEKASKRRAFVIMFIPVIASGTVNFLAPAPTLIKVLAAFIVVMVPVAQSLRFIRPDFAKIERMETEVATQIAVAPAVDEALKAKRSESAKKAAETRKRNARKITRTPKAPKAVQQDTLASLFDGLEGVVPISPAPAGR